VARLTNRERYLRLMGGEPVDRAPFLDIMGFWGSTLKRWKTEGLDPEADAATVRDLVGFDGQRGFQLPVKSFIWPEFERELIEEDGERILVRNRWGGIEKDRKGSGVMPLTVTGAVTDRASWEAIKKRLDPDTPGRLPDNWDDVCRRARASNEPVYAGDLPTGFFGGPRELLGFERQVTLFYDDPALMHEILDTLCDLWIALYSKVQRDVPLDWFFVWEDMCFKNGPLVSPETFREFLLPRYKRLTAALREGGCRHVMVDSDGDMRKLVPLWLEGGVDITFPWETQFGLDVTEVRRRYPAMGMIGGIDKSALAKGRAAIDAELAKVPFMLESGRYIPGLDHGVPPDVSWDDYRYFYERLWEMIGRHPPRPDRA
jgi:uroporphyrinogen decarboxylase